MLLVLVVVALAFQALTDGLFLTPRNLSNLARQASLTAILAAGMVAIIVAGHIDLSAGSAVGLVTVVAAWLQVEAGWQAVPAIVASLGAGLAMGIWQGGWIAFGRVPSFVVTLGGMLIFRGIALVITEGQTLSPLKPDFVVLGQGFLGREVAVLALAVVYLATLVVLFRSRRANAAHGLPVPRVAATVTVAAVVLIVFTAVGAVGSLYLGIPYPVFVMVVIAALLAFVMRRTSFGRRLYAIGGNPEAAALSGISIPRHTFAVFVLMGLLYGLVGVLLAARLDSGPPNAGTFMELDAIAAAVIGGTSLLGGIGSIEGAIVGALLMASISNGMSLMNILTWWQQIVTGLLLMGAVFVDINSKRRAG
jgi:D-xylose transport system permease protein